MEIRFDGPPEYFEDSHKYHSFRMIYLSVW
jgi:hypothetical protein